MTNTPKKIQSKIETLQNRRKTRFTCTISDERGDELLYNNVPISKVVEDKSLGKVIGLLWLKKDLPDRAVEFITLVLIILADHGPAVSGATNTIITARAGKDLVSSLVSWLLTIWPRFGGAIDGAAKRLFESVKNGDDASTVLSLHKKQGKLIQWIGHKVKSKYDPDKRCEIIDGIAKTFPNTPHYDLAREVEALTLEKKPNLILNVDGAIAALLLDMLYVLQFTSKEIQQYIDVGLFNGFFVLARSIGFIGHYLDQQRLNEWLYRTSWEDIHYGNE